MVDFYLKCMIIASLHLKSEPEGLKEIDILIQLAFPKILSYLDGIRGRLEDLMHKYLNKEPSLLMT